MALEIVVGTQWGARLAGLGWPRARPDFLVRLRAVNRELCK
jgi:hypothetical protein